MIKKVKNQKKLKPKNLQKVKMSPGKYQQPKLKQRTDLTKKKNISEFFCFGEIGFSLVFFH